ncbi:MAG: hypothetical protein LUE10_01630 [Alistipes sp.]|nr:hypothetical protein [Alistipes sp.]
MDIIHKYEGFGAFREAVADGSAPRFGIERVNWPCEFPHRPKVSVAAGHDGKTSCWISA